MEKKRFYKKKTVAAVSLHSTVLNMVETKLSNKKRENELILEQLRREISFVRHWSSS